MTINRSLNSSNIEQSTTAATLNRPNKSNCIFASKQAKNVDSSDTIANKYAPPPPPIKR